MREPKKLAWLKLGANDWFQNGRRNNYINYQEKACSITCKLNAVKGMNKLK